MTEVEDAQRLDADASAKLSDAQDTTDVAPPVKAAPAAKTKPAVSSKARRKRSAPSKTTNLPVPKAESKRIPHAVSQNGRPAIILACVVAGAVATACLGRRFARRKHRRRDASTPQLLNKCKLEPSYRVQHATPAPPLHSTSFVTTDVFHIEQLSPDHQTKQHGAEGSTGFSSAPAIQQAILAGATCIGRTNTEEAVLGMIDLDYKRNNPAEPGAIVGITASSAAIVVAQRQADFALTSDHLSGARTAAACCGLHAFRPTRDAISKEGVQPIAGELDAVGWICRSSDMLPQLGQALELPGGKMSKTELAKLIVAQDLFGLWGEDLTPACTATLLGTQKWAGEEVAPVTLLVYLRDSVPAARSLMESDSAEELMTAFGKAARLIQRSEFARCQSEQAFSNEDGNAEVNEKSLAAAKQVQTQLHRAMHAALSSNNGYLIIPTMPGPPIQRSAPADELEQFEQRTFELSALATLSGVPQVTMPVQMPGQQLTSISMLSLHKSDMRLLHLAAKISPLIAEAAVEVAAAMAEEEAEHNQHQQAAAQGDAESKGKPSKAERYKAKANEAFKAGDFDGAINGYSGAIQADPGNPVYFSNRAMAYLKVMQFEQAKEDCDSALNLELNVKTLLRRGTAWLGLQDIDNARKDFKHVLTLEPNNRQARQELKALKETEAMFDDQESDIPNGGTEGLL